MLWGTMQNWTNHIRKPSSPICTLNRCLQQRWMAKKHYSQPQQWILLCWHFQCFRTGGKLWHRVQQFISAMTSTGLLGRQEGAEGKQESVARACALTRWSQPEQSSRCVMQLPAQPLLKRESWACRYDCKEFCSTTTVQQVFYPDAFNFVLT